MLTFPRERHHHSSSCDGFRLQHLISAAVSEAFRENSRGCEVLSIISWLSP